MKKYFIKYSKLAILICKYCIVFHISLFLVFNSLTAQVNNNSESKTQHQVIWKSYKPIQFGLRMGYSLSTFMGNDASGDEEYNSGFSGGLLLIYNFHEYFTLQTELDYFRKSADIMILSEQYKVTLNYLVIPVHFKFSFASLIRNYPFISIGPYFGYCFNSRITGLDEKNSEDINKFDYGLSYIIGYYFKLSNHKKLFIDFRYSMGLYPVFKKSAELEVQNSTFLFSAGFIF